MSNAPTSIGRYEVLGSIGRGGMGSLFLALDPLLDRQIAVKLLRDDDDELRERFAREARAAARLRHPNIVTIFDVGEHEGQPFIAMEYIQGQTLAEVVRGNVSLPIARKLELVEALCDGLGFAHRSGIIHRDIKPANLMIDADGSLKILDFGIARAAESSGMTQAGMLIGTLNYMSPEQVSGQTVDARSDLFAVGAVFYELIAYRQAFPGGLMAGVLNKILSGQPEPLPSIVSDLDPEVVGIIGRALEKEPDRRYPDLATMRQDVATARARLTLGGRSHETLAVPPSTDPGTPRPTPSSAGRRSTDLSELARRRTEQVTRHVEAAEGRLAAGELEAAIGEAEQALMLDASHGPAHDVIEKARAAIELRQLDQALEAAAGGLSAGDLAAAGEHLARAAEINPDAPRVEAFRRSLNQAIEREEERRQREALEARVRETIDESDRQFAAGRHEEAIAVLAAFKPTHPLVAQALERKRSEFDRIVEARRLEAERVARAEAEAREREAREARARAEREQAERERKAREKAEREEAARARAERDCLEREKQEQAAREKAAQAERDRREKVAREKAERERKAREKAEREEAERRARAAAAAATPADDATIVIARDGPRPAGGATERRPAAPQEAKAQAPARPVTPAIAGGFEAPSPPAGAMSPVVKIAGVAAALVVVVIAAFLIFGGSSQEPQAPPEQVALADEPPAVPGSGDNTDPLALAEEEPGVSVPVDEAPPPATTAEPPAPPAETRPAERPPANGNAETNTALNRLLADAEGARARGDRGAALQAIEKALALRGSDDRFTALARDMRNEAERRASQARDAAGSVGAAATGHVTFREGNQLIGSASGEDDVIASARAFMAAETRFNTAAAEGRKAAPPPPVEAPAETGPSPAEMRAAAEKAVRAVVERYRRAYNSLDADAVAAVFPSGPISQLRLAWGGVEEQTVTFTNLSVRLDESATSATVAGAAETVMQPRGGSSQRASAPMTLVLQKSGNNWVITERR